jgi:tartrate dehydrogenase/decarboxylase/D-malate dehydrogenase
MKPLWVHPVRSGCSNRWSLGIAASANLNPERRFPSMFEPIHGSAPDIAGLGVANPVAAVWSGALMLDHLGGGHAAARIMCAMERTLADPRTRTKDLGGTASTQGVVDALLAQIAIETVPNRA